MRQDVLRGVVHAARDYYQWHMSKLAAMFHVSLYKLMARVRFILRFMCGDSHHLHQMSSAYIRFGWLMR